MTTPSTVLLRKLSPFPTVGEKGDLSDGILYSQPRACSRCRDKECRVVLVSALARQVIHRRCPKGLSTYQISIEHDVLVVNGMIDGFENRTCPRELRKSLRANRSTLDEISRWRTALLGLETQIVAQAHEETVEALAGLHDIKAATSVIFRNAETLIAECNGKVNEDGCAGAGDTLRSLLYSVDLLRTRLSFPSIVANPASASFGQKRYHGIYPLFDRMQRLFSEAAERRHVSLSMMGSSFKKIRAYDSIEVLALVLVDNAVKYSKENRKVTISVNDESNGVRVKVETHGEIVPEHESMLIFSRGYRTASAKRLASSGSGLGLYAAQVIAKAHDTKIVYSAVPDKDRPGEGRNIFEVFIAE